MRTFQEYPKDIQSHVRRNHADQKSTDIIRPDSYLTGIFIFSETVEGHSFWREVTRDLNHYYTKYPKKTDITKPIMIPIKSLRK